MKPELILLTLFIGAVLIISASIFAVGGTFGHRCSVLHPNDNTSRNTCVKLCSSGEITC